jgi:GNAT superfamily N-acetyltransferase
MVRERENAFRLRVAGPADIEKIVGLVESAYRGESSRAGWTTEADLLDGQRTDPTSVRELLAAPNSDILLADQGSELVGCCHLDCDSALTAHFGLFAVRPELQGKGIGRWLIGEAERWARRRYGVSIVRMTVIWLRGELIAWYERLGYQATGERVAFPYGDKRFGIPRRDNLEFIVLEKHLGE